ncbi:uncharacterized protein BO97DRAFT_479751 [Aspergillus homomorphus CBS 101889]|uniref:C6 transcription factor n=1 Tax=Aspergillus homomorphus (strain CBS 101889) TaxID=1450537 RepID=A0A395HQ70_ASPHC|nr:hypothetical protein BO97DRAFT_479751 [Aspergillus homomorphus CBS 101889]RAL09890.1 hypothetical protein BO97DRAFT_479751 [Aspergillus homomorphus CBS 101889]
MVSTRHHPNDFPPPPTSTTPTTPTTPSPSSNNNNTTTTTKKWVHTPSTAITLWLFFSTPVVLWDASYVLLRPHSMPGHALHSPLWTPYALYGTIDYMYGWPAFNARNGFTAAQTVLNLFECAGYLYYLAVVYTHGTTQTAATGRGGQRNHPGNKGVKWLLTEPKVVAGRTGALALLVAYSASVMTLGKTVLYWLNEVFSGFDNVGHNDFWTLLFYWIIPNGLWIIFPGYNMYILGAEIVAALETAVPRQRVGRPKSS